MLCHRDDILVNRADLEEHNKRLEEALARLAAPGITLNDKYEFAKASVNFWWHVLSSEEVQTDPEGVRAIVNFQAPVNVTGVRQYVGMVNQVARFIHNLSEMLKLFTNLLRKNT